MGYLLSVLGNENDISNIPCWECVIQSQTKGQKDKKKKQARENHVGTKLLIKG